MGTVVITGGSRGMGRETAIKFAEEGHDVVITYQSNVAAAQEVLAKVEALGQAAHAVRMDVGVQEDIDRAFDEIEQKVERIDYLYNNAGIMNELQEFQDQSWGSWERIFAVNVIGQWYCTKRAVQHMCKHGAGGSVVYCSSISGVMSFPLASDYAASKHAVVGMSKGQALECARHNIRINVICPGFHKTDMYEEQFGDAAETLTETMIPASRIAEPREVANLVYWLMVEGTYCCGTTIVADGGLTTGPKYHGA
ncbi:MAG: SDR family oxidoreductase [Gammaproteobacteria bacterium]|nr:SDR family oxidoreductase [Gammaproteobacteria bacterium]